MSWASRPTRPGPVAKPRTRILPRPGGACTPKEKPQVNSRWPNSGHELGEDQGDHADDGLVGMPEKITVGFALDQPDRQSAAQLAAGGLATDPAVQAGVGVGRAIHSSVRGLTPARSPAVGDGLTHRPRSSSNSSRQHDARLGHHDVHGLVEPAPVDPEGGRPDLRRVLAGPQPGLLSPGPLVIQVSRWVSTIKGEGPLSEFIKGSDAMADSGRKRVCQETTIGTRKGRWERI
jgi:hypothetical protein